MARYRYGGRSREGHPVEGELEALSQADAAVLLQRTGISPVRIQEAASPESLASVAWNPQAWLQPAFPAEGLLNFCRQMHTLLRAGVPITRALAAVQEGADHPGFCETLLDLRRRLESGLELSSTMQGHPRFFSPFFLSMVRIGEATGRLDEIFQRMFQHLEFQKEMDQRVKTATRYPTFVAAAIGLALVIINLFVIPAFAGVYRSMHADLPLMTRLLVGFSEFCLQWWPLLLAALIALIAGFRTWLRSPAGRLSWDRRVLQLPVMGTLLHKAVLAKFCRSLALALRCGMRITEALEVALMTCGNLHVQSRLKGMTLAIDRGESLTSAARGTGVFTSVVLQMLAVGEESGSVEELLDEVAIAYQGDVAYELKTLSDAIEPLLILVLGVIVLILALGVFLPMWDLGRIALPAQRH